MVQCVRKQGTDYADKLFELVDTGVVENKLEEREQKRKVIDK
jgi:hypothetical protein